MNERAPRHQVKLPADLFGAIQAMRDELGERTGVTPTIVQVIDRALGCYLDACTRGAWMSPSEAAPLYEERHRQAVVAAIAQFAALVGRPAREIRFVPAADRLEVDLLDSDEVVSVFVGPPIANPEAHHKAPLN